MFKFGFVAWGDRTNPKTRDPELYFTLAECRIGKNDVRILSPGYMTEHDIDQWVEFVNGQAKQVATQAKKKLRKLQATPSPSN